LHRRLSTLERQYSEGWGKLEKLLSNITGRLNGYEETSKDLAKMLKKLVS